MVALSAHIVEGASFKSSKAPAESFKIDEDIIEMVNNNSQSVSRRVRIVSKALYPYVKRALDLVKRENGDNKTIMIYGSEVSVGTDSDGDIAIFSVSRDYFNIDAVERALRVFVGDLRNDEPPVSPVVIIDREDSITQKIQTDLTRQVKK